jgi:RES domain-containing protein
MIHAWRIAKARRARTAFSGIGARKYGGRWNSPGVAMVYTAGSASLAILEMLVHLQSDELMQNYVVFDVVFDEALVSEISISDQDAGWDGPTVK